MKNVPDINPGAYVLLSRMLPSAKPVASKKTVAGSAAHKSRRAGRNQRFFHAGKHFLRVGWPKGSPFL